MCEGPFICDPCTGGGVLHGAACGHITVTGNWNDEAHAHTGVLMEGLA